MSSEEKDSFLITKGVSSAVVPDFSEGKQFQTTQETENTCAAESANGGRERKR